MIKRKVSFKFNLDDQVVTKLGIVGRISMLAVDDGGIVYYVEAVTSSKSRWHKEKFLKLQEH